CSRRRIPVMGNRVRLNCIGGEDAKWSTTMNKTTRFALAFLAFGAFAGAGAMAKDSEGDNDRPERGGHFQRLDADHSGDVSFEEFSARFEERLKGADANDDGTITVEELADHIL